MPDSNPRLKELLIRLDESVHGDTGIIKRLEQQEEWQRTVDTRFDRVEEKISGQVAIRAKVVAWITTISGAVGAGITWFAQHFFKHGSPPTN